MLKTLSICCSFGNNTLNANCNRLIQLAVLLIAFVNASNVSNRTFAKEQTPQQAKFRSDWNQKVEALIATGNPVPAKAQQDFAKQVLKLTKEQLKDFSYSSFCFALTDVTAVNSILQTAAKDIRFRKDEIGVWSTTDPSFPAQETDALNHLAIRVAQDNIRRRILDAYKKLNSSKDEKQRNASADQYLQVLAVFSQKILRDRSTDRLILMTKAQSSLSSSKEALVVSQIEEISSQNINDPNLNWHAALRILAADVYGKNVNDTVNRTIPLTGQFATTTERDEGTSEAGWLKFFPDLSDGQYGLGREHLADLIRFQKLLISEAEVIENLKPLESRVQQIRQQSPNISAADALSQALTEKETEHGFSNAKIIPLGILPSKLFLTLPAQGYVVQDIGASLDHGEFTHRLQWRSMVESFDREREQKKINWKHTPYELFTLIGQRDLRAAMADQDRPEWERGNSVWVHLMDKLGINDLGGFRHADGMQQYFLDQNKKRKDGQAQLPFIAEAVNQRFQVQLEGVIKYQKQLADFKKAPAAQQQLIASKLTTDLKGSPNTVAFDLFMEEYRITRLLDGSYRLWDPAQPDLPLLIGTQDSKVSEEGVELARLESRKRFGLALTQTQTNRLATLTSNKNIPVTSTVVSPIATQSFDVSKWTEISSPGSGVGGVFFVGNGSSKSVVKFVEESPERVLFAESILGLVNVPTPRTVTYNKDSSEFNSIRDKITILKDSPGSSDRVKQVYGNTVDNATVVQLQTLIVGVSGMESVQNVFSCLLDDKPADKKPVSTRTLFKKPDFNNRLVAVNALLKALSNSEQMQLLGRLSIGDAYLGNEDRLQKPKLNLNNLMLSEEGFVAIDNFSDAPDLNNLAWELAAYNELNDAASSSQTFTQKTKIARSIQLSKEDWFKKIIHGYKMHTSILTADLDMAMKHDVEAGRITNEIKDLTWSMLSDLSMINPALIPIKNSGKKTAGGIASLEKGKSSWNITVVSQVSESQKSKDGVHLSTTDYVLDWTAIEKSLGSGMKDATTLIIAGAGVTEENMNDPKLDKFMKGAIGRNLARMVTVANGEIDAQTLYTRARYVYQRTVGKKTDAQIDPKVILKDKGIAAKNSIELQLWCTNTESGLVISKK